MAQAQPKPAEARRGDGVMFVVQNNATRSLIIADANEALSNLLGYAAGDLTHHNLLEVLGAPAATLIADTIEFNDDAPDFGDVFGRQTSLKLRHRTGQELALPCTVMRVLAEDANAKFQLVLPDERETREKEQLREFLKLNLEGAQTLDPVLRIPDRETMLRHLELLKNYFASKNISASFAVLRLDRFTRSKERYGKNGCVAQLQHVANCCRSTFRGEDVVAVISESMLGLMLMDISRESARMVLNRLRWNVRNHRISLGGKADFSVTVSVVFDMIGAKSAADMLQACEIAAEELSADERNTLIELSI